MESGDRPFTLAQQQMSWMTKAESVKGVELALIQSAILESIEIAKIRGEMGKRCKERTGFKLTPVRSPRIDPLREPIYNRRDDQRESRHRDNQLKLQADFLSAPCYYLYGDR